MINLCHPSFILIYFGPSQAANAVKAKLRRLCEPKKNGRLQVPQWLHDEWKKGNHMKMAREFESCNFNKDTV